jgi:cytochrome c peroxidase
MKPDLIWQDPDPFALHPDVPLEFVHAETEPDEWRKLPQFWNAPLDRITALLGLSPWAAGGLVATPLSVKIKVPLGLDDPRSYIPASNPPTLGKWVLGQALFFDDKWLEAKPGLSCASCHRPSEGFTDRKPVERDSFNVSTLINCVYNSRQFWDGRAELLEEIVQRRPEDERPSSQPGPFRHVWPGAMERLQDRYHFRFLPVFGAPPNQDTVGRALATYLRTLLGGSSMHDLALQEKARKGTRELDASHYEAGLTDAVLVDLKRPGGKKEDVARELLAGYRLFYNIGDTRRANCVACHSGRQFTDGGFYNLGRDEPKPGQETGRFTTVPVGQKSFYLIGAYKTPTLRSLLRTWPYYHNGSEDDLARVVRHHAQGTNYLDPAVRGNYHLGSELKEGEVEALVLFLRALNGEDVAPMFRVPPSAR